MRLLGGLVCSLDTARLLGGAVGSLDTARLLGGLVGSLDTARLLGGPVGSLDTARWFWGAVGSLVMPVVFQLFCGMTFFFGKLFQKEIVSFSKFPAYNKAWTAKS